MFGMLQISEGNCSGLGTKEAEFVRVHALYRTKCQLGRLYKILL